MSQPIDSLNQPIPLPSKPTVERDWLESDLSRLEEYEPYNWGSLDPLTLGKPLQYVPNIGLVVEGGKDNV